MEEEQMLTVPEATELMSRKLRGFMPGGDKIGYRIPESEVRRVMFGGRSPASSTATSDRD